MLKNKDACLLIHGFSGGPFEVMPLADYLAEQGFTVSVPTLAGHDDNLSKLGQANYQDWLASAETALIKLRSEYRKVHIAGFSMGGLIGIYLAHKYEVNSLITLSSPVYVLDFRKIVENIYTGLKNNDYRRIKKYARNIMHVPFKAVANFKLIQRKTLPLVRSIQVPLMVIQGLKDDTVKPKSADYIFNNAVSKTKRIYYLPESSHLICLDVEKDRVFELVVDFISEV
ncbi:Esterase/lipase-like protein [Desulfofarcimen acetoxidans DSM 771]|uniref:Esterase/lipase-like protein n=1 Tax=Desulfofarcimen acetoxidans (strain ATCC 49208 / DSM 771 / KCTC 5769 / VKM B-1644 / 5575) TaxID=485916 RepID=C8VXD2_DESAS|nr:alpha/beta fold hydrolase [Desulfofarcimen acetoxidans]ACV64528.1 Esterase/lipase-like protein [Desulfofarcimen acetoxidans DSM 771]